MRARHVALLALCLLLAGCSVATLSAGASLAQTAICAPRDSVVVKLVRVAVDQAGKKLTTPPKERP